MDQVIEAAQDRLLRKREELKVTDSHTQQIENIDFHAIAERCMAMSWDRGENVILFREDRSYGEDPKPEPEKTLPLSYAGVPKLYLECKFETYQGNGKLVIALDEIARSDSHVILRGNTGCGKTHLAVAMVRDRNVFKALFITVPDLLLKIRSSFNGGSESEDEIIGRYSEIPILVLDDLGAEKVSEFAIATLYIILDRRIRECRKTIITTNLSKEEIEATFGARIASRLAGMENIKINMPDYRKNRL
jgi:DNA replication protein DnaC